MKNHRIILIGPREKSRKYGYGGGAGGYVANLKRYFSLIRDKFEVKIFYVTSRNSKYLFSNIYNFPIRFFIDISGFALFLSKTKRSTIHILGQYRFAAYREISLLFIAKLFSCPVIYDIRGGSFIKDYKNSNFIHKLCIDNIVKMVDYFLVESKQYKLFLAKKFKKESQYIPNFVPKDLLIKTHIKNNSITKKNKIFNLLFVGNIAKGKGIHQLLEAMQIISKNYKDIKLRLVGNIEDDVKNSELTKTLMKQKIIKFYGILNSKDIYKLMRSSSIYIYPTMHYGEGHNNSINEAACFTLPIITTKKGFLGEIFNRDEVFFLNEYQPVNVKEIVRKILYVYKNPQKGSLKATKAKNKLIEKYTSEAISKKLFNTYMKTFKQ